MSRFHEVLRSKHVLLMDGAMGTELQRAGAQEGECLEPWNLTHPDRVRAVHQAYVDAGAVCLVTSSFQSNPAALAKHDLTLKLEAINHAAVAIARSVQGRRFVLGGIGPITDHSADAARQVAHSLHGADALLVETCSDDADLANVRSATPELPILVSFTFLRNADGELTTFIGHTPERCAKLAEAHQVTALGVNCGRDIGMVDVCEIVRRYRTQTALPLFARPNAGTPKRTGDRWTYPHTPNDMAARLPELLGSGITMVGGCCGTTPEHIAAFRSVIDEWNKSIY